MKYYISDLHLCHKACIRYDQRPFNSIDEMNEEIVRRWNERITDEDEVYMLGDFVWAKPNDTGISLTVDYMRKLHGKKYFVIGNHDHCFWEQHVARFEPYAEKIVPYLTTIDNGRFVVMSHYPMQDWDKKFHGSYHLFGHIHNTQQELNLQYPRRYNVGAYWLDYIPRTLDEIISFWTGNQKWDNPA